LRKTAEADKDKISAWRAGVQRSWNEQRGCFARDQSGAVVGVGVAGRLFNRLPTVPT
jgi:hypothetical protein